jgi:hypothetical protein
VVIKQEPKMKKKILGDKENTFYSFHTARPTVEWEERETQYDFHLVAGGDTTSGGYFKI